MNVNARDVKPRTNSQEIDENGKSQLSLLSTGVISKKAKKNIIPEPVREIIQTAISFFPRAKEDRISYFIFVSQSVSLLVCHSVVGRLQLLIRNDS